MLATPGTAGLLSAWRSPSAAPVPGSGTSTLSGQSNWPEHTLWNALAAVALRPSHQGSHGRATRNARGPYRLGFVHVREWDAAVGANYYVEICHGCAATAVRVFLCWLDARRSVSLAPRLLMVGNFIDQTGRRSVGQDLAEHFRQLGWCIRCTSSQRNRYVRLVDTVYTIWKSRAHCEMAQVDVFSGKAFIWAEMACWTLRQINCPYVLTLHGGNLPFFARAWPKRVRRLLNSALEVTTPSPFLLHEMRPYRSHLTLLPNGIHLSFYPFRLRCRPEARLVWLRSFQEIYNPALAVKVLSRLGDAYSASSSLTMAGRDKGDGSLRRTEELALQLGVRDKLNIIPGLPKARVPNTLHKGDIFI